MRSLSPATLGVVLALLAYAAYSTGDAMVKGLGGSLGPFEIGFFTTVFSIIPALFSKPKDERWRDTFKLSRPWLMTVIAVCRTASAMRAFSSGNAEGSSGAAAAEAGTQQEAASAPTLVVFGGRGFVGSAVCQEGLAAGLDVISVTPSGAPPCAPGAAASPHRTRWRRRH